MFPDKLPVCFISFGRAIDLNRPSVLSGALLRPSSIYRKKGLQGLTVNVAPPVLFLPFSPFFR